jgi:hypothetical protein
VKLADDLYHVKYNYKEMMVDLKLIFYRVCCCKCGSKSRSLITYTENLYYKGQEKLERDLNNYTILKKLKKFQAALSLLFEKDSSRIS